MRVDFIILGAQKCATTTLFKILTQHPDIVAARVKEPHFFSTSPDWRRELPRYEALFDQQPGALYCEASTSYTFFPHRNLAIWDDLFAYNPAMKFIYLVRNPVDRIVSSYMHNLARGYTTESLERFVLGHALPLDITRYHTQIVPFIRRFGRDRVLLIDFDDLMQRRQETLRRVAGFLGIPPDGLAGFDQVHANKSVGGRKRHHRFDDPSLVLRGVRKLLPGVWDHLVDQWSPEIEGRPEVSVAFKRMIVQVLELEVRALEHLMEKDLAHWRRVEESRPPAVAEADRTNQESMP